MVTDEQVEVALAAFSKGQHPSGASLEDRMRAALQTLTDAPVKPETAPIEKSKRQLQLEEIIEQIKEQVKADSPDFRDVARRMFKYLYYVPTSPPTDSDRPLPTIWRTPSGKSLIAPEALFLHERDALEFARYHCPDWYLTTKGTLTDKPSSGNYLVTLEYEDRECGAVARNMATAIVLAVLETMLE